VEGVDFVGGDEGGVSTGRGQEEDKGKGFFDVQGRKGPAETP
jgi:hypothetical protein